MLAVVLAGDCQGALLYLIAVLRLPHQLTSPARCSPADLPFFRPDISQAGADRTGVMRCRRSPLLAGGCCRCCHRCWSCSTISSPSAKGESGLRTLFAATIVSGLNTTSKTSVVDLAAPGLAAGDAAAADTVPATIASAAVTAAVRTFLDVGFVSYPRPWRDCGELRGAGPAACRGGRFVRRGHGDQVEQDSLGRRMRPRERGSDSIYFAGRNATCSWKDTPGAVKPSTSLVL